MVGRTISHYHIVEKLGEGGMGVVYKAEDTKLHRSVALKFLRPELTETEELKTRFLHEAEAAASLDHPNICTVHEIDETDGQSFLVMAYIEGQSLSEKIRRRPLPLDEALRVAIQIAEGLQAAHEKGIVHRDIKSSNIMVDTKERVKIMDFGLAHLDAGTRITKTGTVVGTPAYMSPEQVRGEKLDHRTDVWSFGVLIYEMITGQFPFRGESTQSIALAIQNENPEPITAQRAGVPLGLDWAVGKALAKIPDERYQHVDELAVDLRALKTRSTASIPATTATEPSPRTAQPVGRRVLPWSMAALMTALSVLALWAPWRGAQSVEQPVVRFATNLSAELIPGHSPAIAISPDGSKLAYVGQRGETQQLYLRQLGQFAGNPIPGTEGARGPFFSPDGNSLGFFAEDKLKTTPIGGGQPRTLCDAGEGWGGSWGD